MDKLMAVIGVIFMGFTVVFAFSVFGGTVFYLLYPSFQHVFNWPDLTWWQCVAMVWSAHLFQRNNKAELKK